MKTDLLFILCIMLAWLGFARAYLGGGRWALALFWTGLGLAALSKDVLGALGPLVAIALFFWLVRERGVGQWAPWWGVGLLFAVTVPWYAAVERQNPGFLWYTLIDNHVLNFARRRVFPDEDVPLSALAFVVVTLAAFLPWTLALPPALARVFRGPRRDARERLWLLVAIWPLLLIGFFTLSPFKLPHYGLPAFPALALLIARVWDETLDGAAEAPRPLTLMLPVLVFFVALTGAFLLAAAGHLPVPPAAMTSVDVATRNLAARGRALAQAPLEAYATIIVRCAVVFGLAAGALAVAVWRRWPTAGIGAAVAAMLAFLPIAGEGWRSSVAPGRHARSPRRSCGKRGRTTRSSSRGRSRTMAPCSWRWGGGCASWTGSSPTLPSGPPFRRRGTSSGTGAGSAWNGRARAAGSSCRPSSRIRAWSARCRPAPSGSSPGAAGDICTRASPGDNGCRMNAIRSVLVLGGSGQVGTALAAEALRRGIVATGTFRANARPGLVPWDGTLDAFDALVARAQPGLVVYAAGVAHVDRCETEAGECERWNAEVPGALARRCGGACRFVYFSTDYVFDGSGGPYGEEEDRKSVV